MSPVPLLEQMRQALEVRRYSPRTIEAYLPWVRRFIRFHRMQHPAELGAPEVAAFLSHLASRDRVAASTQNQALAAILFLYTEVLGRSLEEITAFVRAKRPVLVLVLAVVSVWVSEALNTAFEFLCDVASPEFHPLVEKAKDVAAGAVLICALGAAIVGLLIFGPPMLALLS